MFAKISAVITDQPVVFTAYGVLIAFLIGVGVWARLDLPLKAHADFSASEYVTSLQADNTPIFEGVRDSMKKIIAQGGIQGLINVNEYAFRNNLYGIYQCHVISHLTGHEAVVYYGTDYEKVMEHDTHFCEVGYRHGAEAQVALSGGNYKEELYRMCDAILAVNPSAECFHGAGHAFMNETLDVDLSLQMCDDLINETHDIESVTPCYNAVFAELTNLVGGKDGGTGIEYTGGPPLSLDQTPLEYCSKFAEQYRVQCLFEFSGLGVSENSTPADIERKLRECSMSDYEEVLEAACIRSVSAVGAQHELAQNHTIIVPKLFFTLSDELRRSYISGAGTEMKQYLLSGAQRNWHEFCDQFIDPRDIDQCTRIFDSRR